MRFTQKGVDGLMIVDLCQLATRGIDHLYLISGDGDLVPGVKAAQAAGAMVELVYFPDSPASSDLLDVVDERTEVDEAFLEAAALTESGFISGAQGWKEKQRQSLLKELLRNIPKLQSQMGEEEEEEEQEEGEDCGEAA